MKRRARAVAPFHAMACIAGWAAFVALSFGGRVAAAGSLEGTVALPATRSAPVPNQRYEIVSKAGVMAPNPPVAIVYLEGEFPLRSAPETRQVAQKDLRFVPSLLAIQVGTRVEFPNLDATYHNIFSFSPAKRFDLGRYRSDEKPVPSVLFEQPGLVTLRCDIHEHMRALILVLPTPFFVLTDTDGHYRLTGIPPGRYQAKAWIDSRSTRSRPVEVRDGAATGADFP